MFFCPFLLYASHWCNVHLGDPEFSVAVSRDSFTFSLHYGSWETGKLIVVCIVSCIIGTIIYHLEKNIYSYSVQCMFELFSSVIDKFSWVSPIIISLLLTLAFSPLVSVIAGFSTVGILICYIFSVYITLCVISIVFSDNYKKVCTRTQKTWIIEDEQCVKISVTEHHLTDVAISRLLMAHAISKKVSTWSDFIHCVQSCCFAWIVGSCLVKRFISADADITLGNSIAIALLFLELIFDWHRYQHVIAMTDGSFSQPEFKHTK